MKSLYDDTEKTSAAIDELWSDEQRYKQELAKLWERNAAFANGNQTFWNNSGGTAQISGNQFYVSNNQDRRSQLYITNEIEPIVRAIASFMTRSRPTIECFPSDKSEVARGRAKLGERVIDAKYVLDHEQENSKKAAYYAMTFGTVFRKDFWDNSAGRDCEIPVYDELGNEVIDPETGKVQMQNQKTGSNNVAILPPMTVGFDWSASSFKELPFIHESYLMPIEWIKQSFLREEPGYTGQAAQVSEGAAIGNSLTVWERMKYATPFSYGNGPRMEAKNKALVTEFYIAPSSECPTGRLIIKAGGFVVYDSFLNGQDIGNPYFLASQNLIWHPYTVFTYMPYVGRLFGKSLVEGLIPLQMRLNEINGAILQNANTMAKPDWIAAEDQLKRGILNGQGAQINVYTPRPDAPPPNRIQGVPLPEQFFKEKQDLIDAMVREAGTNFVMNGQPPKGVTAASAIEQILENSNSQLSDMQISWTKFHEEGFTKKLRLIRQFADQPMEEVTDYLRTLDQDALDDDIKSFVGEDIGDGLTLRIEEQSMVPKSEKAKRDFYFSLVNGPMAQFFAEDSPRGEKLRAELFEEFGEEGFETDEQVDVKKAKWEDERMLKMQPTEVWEDDNHQIHLSCHISRMKDPKFLERASDEVKAAFQQHIDQHKFYIQQAQMQQMQQQMMMQGAPAPQLKSAAEQAPTEEQPLLQ